MVEEKGLAPQAADKIGGFVLGNAGPAKELWSKLAEGKVFGDHPVSQRVTLASGRIVDEGGVDREHASRFWHRVAPGGVYVDDKWGVPYQVHGGRGEGGLLVTSHEE